MMQPACCLIPILHPDRRSRPVRMANTWDEAGNMLTKTTLAGMMTYEWNYDNRLLSVTDPTNQVTSYGYDPWGIRVRMTDASGTKRFLYSREDIIAKYDNAGSLTAGFSILCARPHSRDIPDINKWQYPTKLII